MAFSLFSFSFLSLLHAWVYRRDNGQLFSAAIADLPFKQYSYSNQLLYCCGFGFALFSSLWASQKESSLDSTMVVAFMNI